MVPLWNKDRQKDSRHTYDILHNRKQMQSPTITINSHNDSPIFLPHNDIMYRKQYIFANKSRT